MVWALPHDFRVQRETCVLACNQLEHECFDCLSRFTR